MTASTETHKAAEDDGHDAMDSGMEPVVAVVVGMDLEDKAIPETPVATQATTVPLEEAAAEEAAAVAVAAAEAAVAVTAIAWGPTQNARMM